MILSCSNISRSFGDNHILKRVSFHIEEHEKAAVVGINGAGKSTLLKIIIGDLAPDEGSVTWAKGASIGYLAQHQDLEGAETIYDALLEVKRPILEMEERLRNLEQSMKSASGEELEAMLYEYSRLNHAFELENGYACRSEITGVLKGLGFSEDEAAALGVFLHGRAGAAAACKKGEHSVLARDIADCLLEKID